MLLKFPNNIIKLKSTKKSFPEIILLQIPDNIILLMFTKMFSGNNITLVSGY